MTKLDDSKFLDDPEFQSLLVGCLESLQRGESIDRAALARDLPKYANEIGRFLDDRAKLESVTAGFEDVDGTSVAISAYEHTVASDFGSPKNDFAVGDSVRYIGEYEILEEIARGGMGVVFKARQQSIGRIVALKMILAGRLADHTDIERFRREAKAAGRLKHPNIVPVHGIGEHDGRHYFTMDFVDGPSLAEEIREETLAPRAAAQMLRVTAQAIQYAHEQGTVHRDLKPANLLVDQSGGPQITDFGLARIFESVDEQSRAELTASGQILGTPSYMSPEQAAGKHDLVGPASDIYSLGAILYASLTGRAPFVADSPVDTLLQVIKKEPVSPRVLNPAIPKDLETICLKCLTKEPHRRYGTAQELADDLNRFLEGRPVLARPLNPATKLIRWAKRNPTVAALSVTSVLLLIGGIVVSSFFAVQSGRRAEAATAAHSRAEQSLANEQRAADEAQTERDRARYQQQRAEVVLAGSLLDQARAIRLAKSEGHRWEAMDLLHQSQQLCSRFRDTNHSVGELTQKLPKTSELRTAAVATLLQTDARLLHTNLGIYEAVSPASQFAGLLEVTTGKTPSPNLRVMRLADDQTVGKLNLVKVAKHLSSPNFAIHPTGKLVAHLLLTEIRLTEVASGKEVASLLWPDSEAKEDEIVPVMSMQGHLAFSADGRFLTAFRSHDGKAASVLWELPPNLTPAKDQTTSMVKGELLSDARASLMGTPCFDAKTRQIAYPVSERTIEVRDLHDDSTVNFEIAKPWVPFGPMSLSHDGNTVALVVVRDQPRNAGLVVWDLPSNSEKHRIITGAKIWFAPKISPNRRFLAVGTPEGSITIFDLESKSAVLNVNHGGAIRDLGWFDDSHLWSTAAGALKRWKVALERPVRSISTAEPGKFASSRIQFSPDGSRLVANNGRSKLSVHGWPKADLLRTIELPVRSTIDVSLSRDGRMAVATGIIRATGGVKSAASLAVKGIVPTKLAGIDLDTGEKLFEEEQKSAVRSAITSQGVTRILRKEGKTLRVTEGDDDHVIWSKTFEGQAGMDPIGAFDPQGTRLAMWVSGYLPNSPDPSLQVWDLQKNRQLFIDQDAGENITAAFFSLDGHTLVTIHTDNVLARFGQSIAEVIGTVCVRDAQSGAIKLKVDGTQAIDAAVTSDGVLVAIQYADRQIEVWSVAESKMLFAHDLPKVESTIVQTADIEFTPDGEQLAVVGNSKGLIEMLDLAQIRELLKPVGLSW